MAFGPSEERLPLPNCIACTLRYLNAALALHWAGRAPLMRKQNRASVVRRCGVLSLGTSSTVTRSFRLNPQLACNGSLNFVFASLVAGRRLSAGSLTRTPLRGAYVSVSRDRRRTAEIRKPVKNFFNDGLSDETDTEATKKGFSGPPSSAKNNIDLHRPPALADTLGRTGKPQTGRIRPEPAKR